MWLFGIIIENRMVALAGNKLEQLFPALERPICGFVWLPLSTWHMIPVLCAHSQIAVTY